MKQHTVAVQGHPEKGHLLIEWFKKAGAINPSYLHGFNPEIFYYLDEVKALVCDSPRLLKTKLVKLTFFEWEAMIKEQEKPKESIWTKEELIERAYLLGYFNRPDLKDWTEEVLNGELKAKVKAAIAYLMALPKIQPPSTLNSSNQ